MQRGTGTSILTIAFCHFVFVAEASGQTADFFVDDTAGGNGTGTSWANAFTEIQPAIAAASALGGGVPRHIAVAEGTYTNSTAGAVVVSMLEDIHIHGGFAGGSGGETDYRYPDGRFDYTIIDGEDDATHCIAAFSSNFSATTKTVVDGFTVERGLADGSSSPNYKGGGIYVEGGATYIRLEYLDVSDNKADDGAGTGQGGGIYHKGAGDFECIRSVIEDNIAPTGAGFYTDESDNNTFGNTVFKNNGFGFTPPAGEPQTTGGAIYMKDAIVSAMNCAIFDNEAATMGAAVFWDPSGVNNKRLSLRHCTLAYNSTDTTYGVGLGSGIHILGGSSSNSLDIANSILWAEDPGYDIFWGGTAGNQVTLNVSFSCVGDSWNTGVTPPGAITFPSNVTPSDPQFLKPAARDLRLSKSGPSPCIDTGSNGLIPADAADVNENGNTTETLPIDLMDNDRVYDALGGGAIPDMGAYEATP